MIKIENKLVDNNLTMNELKSKVEVKKTSVEDLDNIVETLSKAFDIDEDFVLFQLNNSKFNIDESIKLCDKDTNEMYGLLTFCDYPIMLGSPIKDAEPSICKFLSKFKQINGHAFIIDERLRGLDFDKEMIYKNIDFLHNYDMIWIGVEKDLKSHQYWKKLGFTEVFHIDEATFYMMPLSKKFIDAIYN